MLIFYCREFKEAKSATPTAENTPFFKTGLEKMMKKEVKAVREDPVISATNTEHVVKTDAEELDRRNSSEKVGRGEESRSEQSRSRERDKRVASHTEERNSTVPTDRDTRDKSHSADRDTRAKSHSADRDTRAKSHSAERDTRTARSSRDVEARSGSHSKDRKTRGSSPSGKEEMRAAASAHHMREVAKACRSGSGEDGHNRERETQVGQSLKPVVEDEHSRRKGREASRSWEEEVVARNSRGDRKESSRRMKEDLNRSREDTGTGIVFFRFGWSRQQEREGERDLRQLQRDTTSCLQRSQR